MKLNFEEGILIFSIKFFPRYPLLTVQPDGTKIFNGTSMFFCVTNVEIEQRFHP